MLVNKQLKSVILLFIVQFLVCWLLVDTPLWQVVLWISAGVEWIIAQAQTGIQFVFGDLVNGNVFFINALLPIVFISAIIGILQHFGILNWVIKNVGGLFSKVFGVNKVVGVNAVCNMFLGQNESLFITRTALKQSNNNTILATLVGGMTSISVALVGVYAGFGAKIEYIIISMVLTALGSMFFCQIFAPTFGDEDIILDNDKKSNVIDTMFYYGMMGFKSVIGIAVALMIFLSMIRLIDTFIPLNNILTYLFLPFGWLLGGTQYAFDFAGLLATRLLTNEVVAFSLSSFATLPEYYKAIATIALCGFAGIGSIGILIGGYSAICPDKVKVVAKLGFKALLIATLTNIFSAFVLRVIFFFAG